MEACGSAHHWARTLQAQGHEVRLLPAQYVRACVRRNKTDAADAAALLEAARSADIRPVPVKTVNQQVLQQLHRIRQQCQQTRTARVNMLRGMLREFGIDVPVGIERGLRAIREAVALLSPLARALGVSTEALLGEQAPPAKRGPAPKLQQQMERIQRLPKPQQRFVMQMIDTVLAQEGR
jgi:transposase